MTDTTAPQGNGFLDGFFKLSAHGTNVRTELFAMEEASVPAKMSDSAWSVMSTICSVLRSWSRLRHEWRKRGRRKS